LIEVHAVINKHHDYIKDSEIEHKTSDCKQTETVLMFDSTCILTDLLFLHITRLMSLNSITIMSL